MKNSKKRFLLWIAVLLTIVIVCVQTYFLKEQYRKTESLTKITLNQALSQSIFDYKVKVLNIDSNTFKVSVTDTVTVDSISRTTKTYYNMRSMSKEQVNQIIENMHKNPSKTIEYDLNKSTQSNLFELLQNLTMMISPTNKASVPLDILHIDSLYKEKLQLNSIYLDYSIRLVDISNHRVIEETNPSLSASIRQLEETSLHPVYSDQSLQAVYENSPQIVLKQMIGLIIFSALMVILTICCLLYFLFIISKQKKMEKIREDFVHSMTHELRNPLQSSMALSEMLTNDSVQQNKKMYKDVVNRVKNNLSDLNKQIESILTLSQSNAEQISMDVKEHDLAKDLEEISYQTKIVTNKPVSIHMIIHPTPFLLLYDTAHFLNAIKNLIDNSIKYSKDTGVNIKIEAERKRDTAVLRITDNGIGISKEELPHIFQQYYRGSSSNNHHHAYGFGLGLSYVEWVVKSHKGSISATSELGKGTEFVINIPIY